ncbi:unnamed protein product [marine sediment metagenome]|uniref:Uncharacterized protein n=1 Tax=marine sediment metagenome TaxID=412755 RepID=X1A030_9ZZZZ
MTQLISATLTKEAAEIYNNWEKQTKSKKISLMICEQHTNLMRMDAMQKQIDTKNKLMAKVIWELSENPIHKSLCSRLNESLIGTLHYQYGLDS